MSADPDSIAVSSATDSSTEPILEDQLKEAARSSGRNKRRLHQAADELEWETKRLRNEAARVESQSKQLRAEAQDAERLERSLEFEALCLALRRDDDCLTELCDAQKYPAGYAKPLGEALFERNTNVTSIELWLKTAIPCIANEDGTVNASKRMASVQPLVHYLEGSDSLRSVTIGGSHPSSAWTVLFLGACFRNQNIENLAIELLSEIPVQVFQNCQFGTSLKHISMVLVDFDYSRQERRLIEDAVATLSSLKSLEISTNNFQLLQSILAGLRSNLDDLELTACFPDESHQPTALQLWSTMSELLHLTKIKHLLLRNFSFFTANIPLLIDGLKAPAGEDKLTTVSNLTLSDCYFDHDARRLLRRFMRTKVQSETASSLRMLDIDRGDGLSQRLTAKDLVAMMSVQRADEAGCKVYHPTIGLS